MKLTTALLTVAAATLSLSATAQEDAIRKALAQRIPQMDKIDEVRATPMKGLYEVRIGTDLFYTDAKGDYVIQGELIDSKARRNLTEDRINKLTAVNFSALPLKDAVTIVRGDGKRKVAVFEDPNCGYCKRFERDMQKVDNVTVYLFLYPILSPDSAEKSRNIWCSKDQAGAWQDMMVRDKSVASASCDTSALQRNLAFGKKHKITGTPTLIFSNGSRVPGAIGTQEVEKRLAEAMSAQATFEATQLKKAEVKTNDAPVAKNQIEDDSGPVDPGDLGIEFRYVEVSNSRTEIIGVGGPCSHLGFNQIYSRNDFVNERNWDQSYSLELRKPVGNTIHYFPINSTTNYASLIKHAKEGLAGSRGIPSSEKAYQANLEIAQCAASSQQQYRDAVYQFHKRNWKKCPGECRPSQLRKRNEPMPFSS